jgi:hypothetical protein
VAVKGITVGDRWYNFEATSLIADLVASISEAEYDTSILGGGLRRIMCFEGTARIVGADDMVKAQNQGLTLKRLKYISVISQTRCA